MSESEEETCAYVCRDGQRCPGRPEAKGLCRWHDPRIDKDYPETRRELEAWARADRPMEGFQLAHAELDDVDLVRRGSKEGYSLNHADLYHASLVGAHMFHIDLRNSSLVKADLSHANLNCADLRGANLLGVNFDHAKLEHVIWGERLQQEDAALEAQQFGEEGRALDYFSQSEEIYRNLRKNAESRGHFENAGFFFYKEMVMRRQQLPRNSIPRLFSKLVDLMCGYGEKPYRVVVTAGLVISIFALGYFLAGVSDGGGEIRLDLTRGLLGNLSHLLVCIYYSVVTFTTLGYGDIVPQGWTRLLAAAEAFIGAFTMSLFVVVFVKKMTR